MIAEIAHGLLWLAAASAALQLYAVWRLPELAVPAALSVGWLWLWIAAALAWVFWSLDFSVAAVAANTQSALPEGLRLAAAVLRPDGVWPVVAALVAWGGAVVAWRGAPRAMLSAVAFLSVALHVVLLIAAPPFARLDPAPVEGAGFAPAWRAALAQIGPVSAPDVAMPFAIGARADGVRLEAVKPVAGPDSTGIVGELRVETGGVPLRLRPEWRETILPRHSYAVPDGGCGGGACWRATIGARRDDGRFMVTVARVPVLPYVIAVALLGMGIGWMVLRIGTRR